MKMSRMDSEHGKKSKNSLCNSFYLIHSNHETRGPTSQNDYIGDL